MEKKGVESVTYKVTDKVINSLRHLKRIDSIILLGTSI